MTKKKKLSCKTDKKVDLGQLEMRISEAKIDIETKAKSWKISYGFGTTPYFILSRLADYGDNDSLRALALALYSTAIFFTDAKSVMKFFDLVKEFKSNQAEPLSEEEDQEVLEEERQSFEAKKEVDLKITLPNKPLQGEVIIDGAEGHDGIDCDINEVENKKEEDNDTLA